METFWQMGWMFAFPFALGLGLGLGVLVPLLRRSADQTDEALQMLGEAHEEIERLRSGDESE